jgi:hypothetical protein
MKRIHEEEYIKGPGMIFAGNPETYLTIIRYPVQKRTPIEDPDESTGLQEDPK